MRSTKLLLFLCFFVPLYYCSAQKATDSAAAKASTFSTSGGRIFWMGANYRKEWNTPVKAPVLNLATEGGGLTPVKRGGGKQTKSLRLEGPDGRQYVLRSIQKFITEKTLPGDLQSEAAADLVSDGVSASYPYASLSVIPLAEAAGIPYGKVKLVYVGDDPRLGEHRKDFSNMLATLEEREPAGIKKVYDTDEVAEKLEKDNDNTVDQLSLLKIRILDMFVMDLDRHEGQWVWGANDINDGKGKQFFPIAKDRDQAFYINQGVLPSLVRKRSLVPQLEGFKAEANNIGRFNFAARNLDRFFLNQLTEQDWKQAVEKFISQMTDEVIDGAMAQQPPEIRGISANKIAQTLKDRRKFLAAEVMEYHRFISEIVNVTGSDKKELFDITRNEDGSLQVQVYKINKDGQQSVKMYERRFDPVVTKEVRIYGMDGEDKFQVNGSNDKIKLRLIGGGGSDAFDNTAKSQRGILLYDKLNGGNTIKGPFKNRMANDTIVNSFERIYYKYPYQSFFGTIGFNPDDGISLGPTFKIIRHGFRKNPYKSLHQFSGKYAFSTKAVNIRYNNEFIGVMGNNTDLVMDFDYKGPFTTTNFFGYGMNSVYDKTQPGKFRFYRARYDLGDFSIQFRHRFSDKVSFLFGPTFQMYHMEADDKLNQQRNIVLNTAAIGLDPAKVFKRQSYFGGLFSFIVDTRNSKVLPDKGINWVSSVRYLDGLNDDSYDNVTQLNSSFTFYFSLTNSPGRLVLVNRVGGGINLGDGFEFFQAQYLGNEDNLRGYRQQRFAGKSKFFNQTELRFKIADFKTYLFPGSIGIGAYYDVGRVWVKNDFIESWASGYGLGLWVSPLRRILLSFVYTMSDEDKLPLVTLGWRF